MRVRMKIIRTSNIHKDFIELTAHLDSELNARYGQQQSIYDVHNKIDPIDTAIVGYIDDFPVACGCFKRSDNDTIEIKRMYVRKVYRRKGFSTIILQSLENWGGELGFIKALLETGKGQPEAIAFYQKEGYHVIENYGPYKSMENSICMEKFLN